MRQKSNKADAFAEVPRSWPMYDEDKALGHVRTRFGDGIFPNDTDRSKLKSLRKYLQLRQFGLYAAWMNLVPSSSLYIWNQGSIVT